MTAGERHKEKDRETEKQKDRKRDCHIDEIVSQTKLLRRQVSYLKILTKFL